MADLQAQQEKNNREFLEAFESYSDALLRHCFFRISDRDRAAELVQETFLRAWEYLSNGEEVRQFRPFLYRVLNNLIIDEYRRKKSISLDAIMEEDGVTEGSFEELHDNSSERTIESLDAKLLLTSLDALPAHYREVVVLRYIDGLSPKEIAVFLEETENAVSVRIHRGLKLLRKEFEHG